MITQTFSNDEELRMALEEVKVAENQFNNCDAQYIDVCIARFKAATDRLNLLIYERKVAVSTRAPQRKVSFKWWPNNEKYYANVYAFPNGEAMTV